LKVVEIVVVQVFESVEDENMVENRLRWPLLRCHIVLLFKDVHV
jgi:hypothetical protein